LHTIQDQNGDELNGRYTCRHTAAQMSKSAPGFAVPGLAPLSALPSGEAD
jgi:hypothetical protein